MNYDVIRGGRRYDSSKLLDAKLCITVKRSIDEKIAEKAYSATQFSKHLDTVRH